jgi:hypothetical protein
MLKSISKLFWVSIVLFFVSCAPKRIEMPSYEGKAFRDVLSDMNSVSQIEAKFSISFEKNDTEMRGDAALNISSGGDMSLRVYSLGFLAMELTSENGAVKSNPRLDRNKTVILTKGLRDCLFWWDIKDFTIEDGSDYFLLENPVRRIWVDKKTFLPKRQDIFFEDGRELTIYYDNPARENTMWYQSKIRIELSKYSVTLTVKNISFKTG